MANANFPTLSSGNDMDSSKFEVTLGDTAMKQTSDGGYVISRSRTTRKPRKSFKGQFTYITETDRLQLIDFYENQVYGTARIFNWHNVQDGVTYAVRFKTALTFTYVGLVANQRWNCAFEFEQA